ncbi:hypothetical protein OIV83_004975 [Microbotryomycetes sp. JL201]|nr:hypothetical protein OIV83_004975 [Microbotryomycetes sp. JL201]
MSTTYGHLQQISVSVQDAIGVLTLDRPQARNSFTAEMASAIVEAVRLLNEDDRVKVIVLKGQDNPGNAFCAGADLSGGSAFDYRGGPRTLGEHRDHGGQTSLAFFRSLKPTIAAINGHAVGIGITMTLGCDIRVVYENAKIGFVFAQRGIVPEAASSYFLPRLIGHSKAMELLLTARVQAASAPSLDSLWASKHSSPKATVDAAMKLAHEIARNNSAISMALTKNLVWRGKDSPEAQHLLDSRAMYVAGASVDAKEGVASFKEKRSPNFPGRVPRDMPTELWPWWTDVDVVYRGPKL